jgi:hypothetical protein
MRAALTKEEREKDRVCSENLLYLSPMQVRVLPNQASE